MSTQETKYLSIIKDIKTKINQGIYPAGYRLPGQFALAKEYGVSAITSNRALNELQRLGFVERRQRSGSFVTDKTHQLTEITILLYKSKAGANVTAQEYCNGIVSRANELNIPTQLISSPDISFAQKLNNKSEKQGFILLNFETNEVVESIKNSYACCVVAGQKNKYADFSIYADFFNITRQLTRTMLDAGCQKLAFLGGRYRANHLIALEGYLAEMKHAGKQSFHFNVDLLKEGNIKATIKEILKAPEPYDGIIITGGHAPITALPYIFANRGWDMKIGLFSDNPLIMDLKGSAYLASFSQFLTGSMAVDMLCEVASNRSLASMSKHPPFKILLPDPKRILL
jgi:DNA-binding transcriptional regulator YhcF (GntR family)